MLKEKVTRKKRYRKGKIKVGKYEKKIRNKGNENYKFKEITLKENEGIHV